MAWYCIYGDNQPSTTKVESIPAAARQGSLAAVLTGLAMCAFTILALSARARRMFRRRPFATDLHRLLDLLPCDCRATWKWSDHPENDECETMPVFIGHDSQVPDLYVVKFPVN